MPDTKTLSRIIERILISWSGDQAKKWECLTELFILASVWDVWEGDEWEANMKSLGSALLMPPGEDSGGLN